MLRRHCAHELAYALLHGLRGRFEAAGCDREARRASELQALLPVCAGGHAGEGPPR